jgi:esterase/lipase superfamily enzyme
LPQTYRVLVILLVTAAITGGCASKPRLLMPTPVHYYKPGGADVFVPNSDIRAGSSDVDLLYITDRGPETDPESTLPYGLERSKSIAFGSARVRIGRGLSWDTLEQQSQSP